MKSTNIIRRIDDVGRIVIPKAIRAQMGIQENDEFEIFIDKDSITFKKLKQTNPIDDIMDAVAGKVNLDEVNAEKIKIFLQNLLTDSQ